MRVRACRSSPELEKKDTLILLILFIFFLSMLYFDPRLLALLIGDEPWFVKSSVIVFVITLNMMWLYGIYHALHITFAFWQRRRVVSLTTESKHNTVYPRVGILYVTRNDFNFVACRSCIQQRYPQTEVFICDDSTDVRVQQQIDTFAARRRVTVFRRGTNRGFKAGNINDAIALLDPAIEFVVISDADSILPPRFLMSTMPFFSGNPRLAFVQAMQRSLKRQPGTLGRALRWLIDIHWQFYVLLKNRYGFVMWYGHGAVLRRSVIAALGGIPEVVTEDLAFSSEARRLGYYGIVAPNVQCGEEFPRTLELFRRRNCKWVRGTFEYLVRFYPKLLRAHDVPWFEKADVFISAFALLQAIPFLMLVAVASFIMPFYYARFQLQGPLFLIPPLFYDSWWQIILRTRYNVFWMLDFYLVMIVVTFVPLLPAFAVLKGRREDMARYITRTSFLHLSVLLDSAKEVVLYLANRRTYFPVTNNTLTEQRQTAWLVTEFFLGLGLIVIALLTNNVWLVSLGAAFALTFFLVRTEHSMFENLTAVPFIVTTAVMFFIGVTILKNM